MTKERDSRSRSDGRTEFVAYNYPGWHQSEFRPETDEWELLDTFQPYFPDHEPPPRPLGGPYDDADPSTAATQIELASRAGITAFLYFTYYRSTEFVMSAPMDNALRVKRPRGIDFGVAGVWCVRLPHDRFPAPCRAELEAEPRPNVGRGATLAETPIELLTLRDLSELVGEDSPVWSEIKVEGARSARHNGAQRRAPAAGDRTTAARATAPAPERTSESTGSMPTVQEIAIGLERYYPVPRTLTLGELRALLERLAAAVASAAGERPGIGEVSRVIGDLDLSGLSFTAVARLVEAVTRQPDDVLGAFTVNQVEQLLSPQSHV